MLNLYNNNMILLRYMLSMDLACQNDSSNTKKMYQNEMTKSHNKSQNELVLGSLWSN